MALLGFSRGQILGLISPVFGAALLGLILISACASNPNARRPPTQQTTLRDLSVLGIEDALEAPVEVRLFRPSCPWCLEDLAALALERPGDHVPVLLIGFNRPGRDNEASFRSFVADDLPRYRFPPGALRPVFVNVDLEGLKGLRNSAGDILFPELHGVPYHLLIDRRE